MPDYSHPPADADQRLLSLTRDSDRQGNPVVPPIYQTSLFTFESYAEAVETYTGRKSRPVYSRGVNPTVQVLEDKLAILEGGEAAIALASGMAAISTALLSALKPGDRLVAVRDIYPDAYRFIEMYLKNQGITVDYVDGTDLQAVEAALPGAAALYLESPVSWTFEALDVAALAAAARKHGATSIIDNSWASPVFQQPLALGCDIVVHSLSKYISGHSDVVAGALITDAARVARIRTEIVPYFGAKLAPAEAFLITRGMRTLALRMRQHETAALEIARRLQAHPAIVRVMHPGLDGLPLGLTGTSGLFAAQLASHVDIEAFCDALRVFHLGVSWGGYESLALPSDIPLMQVGGPNSAQDFGVPHGLVRLSIGLEPVELLWSDIEAALATAMS